MAGCLSFQSSRIHHFNGEGRLHVTCPGVANVAGLSYLLKLRPFRARLSEGLRGSAVPQP